MALFGSRRPAALDDWCDRCGEPGHVRYMRDVVIVEDDGVEVKQLDLVVCRFHDNLNAPVLRVQGWLPVEVAGG